MNRTSDDRGAFDPRRTVVIANPAAQGGRIGRRWPRMERIVRAELGSVQVSRSLAPESIPQLVAHAARGGATTIVSLGGDGTHSAIANALLRLPGPIPALGIAHAGTGGDFRRNLEGVRDLESSLRMLRARPPAPVDVLEIAYHDDAGTVRTRFALNAASCGLSAAVVSAVNAGRGRLGYAGTALAAFTGFAPPTLEVTMDGVVRGALAVTVLAICNGASAGGGLRFAPAAAIGDGALDCAMVAHASLLRSLPLLAALRSQRAEHALVTRLTGTRVEVRALGEGSDVRVEIDGELAGRLPVVATLRAAALQVRGA